MKSRIYFLLFLLTISFAVNTTVFWYYEQNINPHVHNYFDVVWWWMVSSTTVGYGDVVPITVPGRIAAIISIFVGVFFYTNIITIIAETVHRSFEKHLRGLVQVKCKNHIVICEYTAFADELIQELPQMEGLAGKEVVIVTDLVETNPYLQHFFVKGVPINPLNLKKANINEADYIFVFANIRFKDPDVKTLHLLSRIKKLNNHAKIIIELENPLDDLVKHLDASIVVVESRKMLEDLLKHQSIKFNDLMK
ncbi:MAG: ion channel [Ignavibacteriaceae bacterium]